MAFRGPHTAAARKRMSEAKVGVPKSEAHKATTAQALAGNVNAAKWGKARRVDDHEIDWHIREIGRLIRDARVERDVPQEELAAAAGIGVACLTRIEHGKGRRGRNLGATTSTIIRIALALGVRPYELMP